MPVVVEQVLALWAVWPAWLQLKVAVVFQAEPVVLVNPAVSLASPVAQA